MILAAVLALLLLGAVLGARGMRRLGASVRGPWRPGAGVLGLLAAFATLALLARGEVIAALVAGSVALGSLAAARLRASRGRAPPAPSGMTRVEAAALLGVAADASPADAEAAFRRLILKLHPDQGGTAGLSAKLQEARRVMASPSPEAGRGDP